MERIKLGGFLFMSNDFRSNGSLEEVMHAYGEMVYRLAVTSAKRRSDASDIYQEVFFRYYKCGVNFENDDHIKNWLIKTTVNVSKKMSFSAWNRKTVEMSEELNGNSEYSISDETVDLHIALKKLPEKYKTVIHLFYFEDMSVSEIGSALSIKESTIKSRLDRARDMLRRILSEGGKKIER